MNSSPLLLEKYAFTRVEIVASEKPDLAAVNQLNVALGCARHDDDKSRYLLDLELKLLADQHGRTAAYTGSVRIEGYFRVSAQVQGIQPVELVIANGASILYGAIREMVLNITGRGPWPAVTLITTNFSDVARKWELDNEGEGRSHETAEPLKARA